MPSPPRGEPHGREDARIEIDSLVGLGMLGAGAAGEGLIVDFDGTPTQTYGQGYEDHLAALP